MLGAALVFSGRPNEGVAALERSIRLDPRGPQTAVQLNQIALGLYFSRDYATAVEVAKRAIRSYPDFPNPYRWLAATLGQLGRIEEAEKALGQATAIVPGAFETNVRGRVPWMRPEDHAHMLDGLRNDRHNVDDLRIRIIFLQFGEILVGDRIGHLRGPLGDAQRGALSGGEQGARLVFPERLLLSAGMPTRVAVCAVCAMQ
jgi:tetratricopeptide (TPR) repeat protein